MTIADNKREENIIEFILYIWQMEDLIRATGFDQEILGTILSSQFEGDQLIAEGRWFTELSRQMKSQKIEKTGHVSEVHELMTELVFLHNSLLNVFQDKDYLRAYESAKPDLAVFVERSSQKFSSDIEPGLVALYGLLTLRLKKVEVSEGTEESMEKFKKMFAYLANRYKKMKNGELGLNVN